MDKYLQITIAAPAEQEELITMLAFEAGALGVAVDDPAIIKRHLLAKTWDASVFDGQEIITGRLQLTATFVHKDTTQYSDDEQIANLLAKLAAMPRVSVEAQLLADTDWQQKWKESFAPQEIGKNLVICPYWRADELSKERLPILIEPGMAFGTGDHATTAMVLELIEKYLQPGSSVLDLGCGSGILAIAALKLGADTAMGIDIDPVCLESVTSHCELNSIAPQKMSFVCGDIVKDNQLRQKISEENYQLITANITAGIICSLAEAMKKLLAPGGFVLCSGILDRFAADVEQALDEAGLQIIEQKQTGEWLSYALVHKHG